MEATYVTQDKFGMYAGTDGQGPGPGIMGAGTLIGNSVYNARGEHLGDIEEFMVEMTSGTIRYAVLSALADAQAGTHLLAVPFAALMLDGNRHRFVLHITRDAFRDAPRFDTAHWPSMADPTWAQELHRFYGTTSSAPP